MSSFLSGFIDQVDEWFRTGRRFALARVVQASGSAPLPLGAAMVVGPDGRALGSVSGGCVDGAVYQSATEILDGAGARLEQYGYSDNDALAAGLTCGGTVTVLIEPIDRTIFPEFGTVLSHTRKGSPVSWATGPIATPGTELSRMVSTGPDARAGTFGDPDLDAAIGTRMETLRRSGQSGVCRIGDLGDGICDTYRDSGRRPFEVFVHTLADAPRLIVFGASEHAAALATLGRAVGYHVTVCDARPVFTTPDRFPNAHTVVRDWPDKYLSTTPVDPRTAICILTHDPRFDVPAVISALATEAGYIGAMGSRRTHNDRMQRLREAGVPTDQLQRVHSPIGLDLGGRSAEETALSILAEIVAVRTGRSGHPLGRLIGPMHCECSASVAGATDAEFDFRHQA